MSDPVKEVRLAYPEDLIQAVGAYLVTRPYSEVAQLVHGLQSQAVRVDVDLQKSEPVQ